MRCQFGLGEARAEELLNLAEEARAAAVGSEQNPDLNAFEAVENIYMKNDVVLFQNSA